MALVSVLTPEEHALLLEAVDAHRPHCARSLGNRLLGSTVCPPRSETPCATRWEMNSYRKLARVTTVFD
jgi:hypothetical protein